MKNDEPALDAHQTQLEELPDQRLVHVRFLVHPMDERRDVLFGELAHHVAEHLLFLGEHCQRRAGYVGQHDGHENRLLKGLILCSEARAERAAGPAGKGL